MDWSNILYLLVGLFFLWMLYRYYKVRPHMFSTANMGKSAKTMGLLALALIAFVAFCIILLKAG